MKKAKGWLMNLQKGIKMNTPVFLKAFKDDLTSLLNHLRLPAAHRRAIRTATLFSQKEVKKKINTLLNY